MSKIKKSDRTKSEILDVAWEVIAREGAAVKLQVIATEAGVTRQSVYNHFGTRAGLLIALVRHADETFCIWEGFTAAMSKASALAKLEGCLDAWLAFVPKIHPVAMHLIGSLANDKDAAAAWNDRMSELKKFYHQLVEELKTAGILRADLDKKTAVDLLWSLSSMQSWDLLVHQCGWNHIQANTQIKQVVFSTLLVEK
ncbi:TetR/AcrR family transcriptional regulator [Flexibacterium corallicola]|uniref:TetR/AcrR family transcriptional regulator n=1 Tax=Flexibacterium corallicola TaxID=3037259 RepID=UPI00286EDF44|nr:TetR/AcrR family transcriptional regulator [Pseudovibrio sp. M1P-2-3]